MAIRILSGTRRLLAGVRSYFTLHNVTAAVAVGLRATGRQDNQGAGGANRVVFVPFDPKSGAGGRLVPPIHTGPQDVPSVDDPTKRAGAARAIADWERQMVVEVWARDADLPGDDEAQLYAVEDLLEWTKRAVDATGYADVEWTTTGFIVPPERNHGLAVQVGLQFTHPLFDVPDEVGYPGFDLSRADAD